MKKKMNNKGFTLVELIVVLVILAILAAILVPTLLGYIERAKSEKDYSTAQTIRVAMQSAIAEAYAKDNDGKVNVNEVPYTSVWKLVGATVDGSDNTKATLDGVPVSIDKTNTAIENNQITKITVVIDGSSYRYSSAAIAASNGAEAQTANTWMALPKTTP